MSYNGPEIVDCLWVAPRSTEQSQLTRRGLFLLMFHFRPREQMTTSARGETGVYTPKSLTRYAILLPGTLLLAGSCLYISGKLSCLLFVPWALLSLAAAVLWTSAAPTRRSAVLGAALSVLAVFVAGGAGIVLLERPPIPMDVMCEDFLSPLVLLLTPLWTILAGLCAFGIRTLSGWARSRMAT